MAVVTSATYQLPAQVTLNGGFADQFIVYQRAALNFNYVAGNLAAATNVTILTGVANIRYVILKVFWSFATATYMQLLDGASAIIGWRTVNANFLPIILEPYGHTLGGGNSLVLRNNGAAATDYDITVYYTSEIA